MTDSTPNTSSESPTPEKANHGARLPYAFRSVLPALGRGGVLPPDLVRGVAPGPPGSAAPRHPRPLPRDRLLGPPLRTDARRGRRLHRGDHTLHAEPHLLHDGP